MPFNLTRVLRALIGSEELVVYWVKASWVRVWMSEGEFEATSLGRVGRYLPCLLRLVD